MDTDEAEGLILLELWDEAWEVLEDLPPRDKATPEVLRLRLRCCIGLKAWGIGHEIARLLRDGGKTDRVVAAGYYHAHAVAMAIEGKIAEGKESVKAAGETWDIARIAMLEDIRLEPLF